MCRSQNYLSNTNKYVKLVIMQIRKLHQFSKEIFKLINYPLSTMIYIVAKTFMKVIQESHRYKKEFDNGWSKILKLNYVTLEIIFFSWKNIPNFLKSNHVRFNLNFHVYLNHIRKRNLVYDAIPFILQDFTNFWRLNKIWKNKE